MTTPEPSLGRRLEVIRVYHGLTQQQLALVLNVSQEAISYWENDRRKPEWDVCKKICEIAKFKESFLAEAYNAVEDNQSERISKGQKQRKTKEQIAKTSQIPLVHS